MPAVTRPWSSSGQFSTSAKTHRAPDQTPSDTPSSVDPVRVGTIVFPIFFPISRLSPSLCVFALLRAFAFKKDHPRHPLPKSSALSFAAFVICHFPEPSVPEHPDFIPFSTILPNLRVQNYLRSKNPRFGRFHPAFIFYAKPFLAHLDPCKPKSWLYFIPARRFALLKCFGVCFTRCFRTVSPGVSAENLFTTSYLQLFHSLFQKK